LSSNYGVTWCASIWRNTLRYSALRNIKQSSNNKTQVYDEVLQKIASMLLAALVKMTALVTLAMER
jgi:hypothetical protein